MTYWMTIAALLSSALLGGLFFAFSSFIMRSLSRVPAAEGIRAMQVINVEVFHPSFMIAFFGTPLMCIALGVQALSNWHEPGAAYRLGGAAIYLLGSFLVTLAGNVPRNNALARVDPDAPDAEARWEGYAVGWTRWNHIRTIASMAAAGAFLAALVR